MARLDRTTFESSRAGEYFDARQLSALTGVPQGEFASVCLKELIDNALDACETAGVAPEIGVEVEQDDGAIRLSVSDNGSGIPPEVVRKVLDYSVRVSDKAAYRSPTRGAQGNALKTIIGIPYALGSRELVVVVACGVRHTIRPWVDPAGEVRISHTEVPEEAAGTRVSLEIPEEDQDFDPLHWMRSFAAFNSHATFGYQVKRPPRKWPKCTNRPASYRSRSTSPPSQPPRIGTARRPFRRSYSATSPTPAMEAGTYPSGSS